jgi:hypothetical protein
MKTWQLFVDSRQPTQRHRLAAPIRQRAPEAKKVVCANAFVYGES